MNYLQTKLFAFTSIFCIIAGGVSSLVLIGFLCWWFTTGVMPSRTLFLELVIIPTITIQFISYLTSIIKKAK